MIWVVNGRKGLLTVPYLLYSHRATCIDTFPRPLAATSSLSLERERPLAIPVTMAGGKVAKANEGEAAEPTMDEAKAELTGLVKQLGILPLLWGSGKIDFTQEDNVYYLRAGFCVCIGLAYLVTMRAISKVRRRSTMVHHTSIPSHKRAHTACAWCTHAQVKRRNDSGRVKEPGTSMYLKDEDKAEDGSVSVRTCESYIGALSLSHVAHSPCLPPCCAACGSRGFGSTAHASSLGGVWCAQTTTRSCRRPRCSW